MQWMEPTNQLDQEWIGGVEWLIETMEQSILYIHNNKWKQINSNIIGDRLGIPLPQNSKAKLGASMSIFYFQIGYAWGRGITF